MRQLRWLGLALSLLLGACEVGAPIDPDDPTPVTFEVPRGTTPKALGAKLVQAGLLAAEWQWDLYRHGLGGRDPGCLKAGKFQLARSMSLDQVVETLCGPPLADEVSFTVIEGWRIRDIDQALAARGLIQPGAYAEVAEKKALALPFPIESPTLEGYLYPETYKVPAAGADVEKLITRQLETFRERFLSKYPEFLTGGGLGERTLHEIVVVASMLEREEPRPENRPLVSGIIWKRLRVRHPLGIDATSRYTLPDWNDERAFLRQLRDPDEPYNTRKKRGLPPTAIGNPEISSLEAAIHEQESEYFYYLHDKSGNLHPARDLAGHEANRRKYGIW